MAARYGPEPISGGGALNWTNWVAGVRAVYATLFGVGRLLFHDAVPGLLLSSPETGAPHARAAISQR